MASLMFLKGTFAKDASYVDGAVYFDNGSHEIRVGNASGSYDAFGSDIKDVVAEVDGAGYTQKVTISFYGGKADAVIDLSDMASADAFGQLLDTEVFPVLNSLSSTVGASAAPAEYYASYAEYAAAKGEDAVSEEVYNELPADSTEKVKKAAVEDSGLVKAVKDLDADKQDKLSADQLTAIASVGKANSAAEGEASNATGLHAAVESNAAAISALQNAGYLTEVPVDGVKEGDKFISLDGKKITSTISIAYDSDNAKLQLKGIGGEVVSEFDASAFIADGILESAAIVDCEENEAGEGKAAGKYFKFTWNADAGSKVSYVSIGDFGIKGYSAGADIAIDATNKVSVSLSNDVVVAGGPLADDLNTWPSDWKNSDGANIIPAGKSLEEILTVLFLKETIGTVSDPVYYWSPSLEKPQASLAYDTTEVGETATVTVAAQSYVSGNTANVTVIASNGYFDSVDGDYKSSPYMEYVSGSIVEGKDTAIATATFNGTAVDNGGLVTLKEGVNTLSVKNSGITVHVDDFAPATVYASTNTKKVASAVYREVDVDYFAADKDLESTATATVTAYYPIYTNGVSSSTTATTTPSVTKTNDSTKLPLVADKTAFGVAFAAQVDGGEGYRLLIQKDKTITSALALNAFTSKYDIDVTSKFVKESTTVTKATGDTTAQYYVWEYKGTEGANRVNFKID